MSELKDRLVVGLDSWSRGASAELAHASVPLRHRGRHWPLRTPSTPRHRARSNKLRPGGSRAVARARTALARGHGQPQRLDDLRDDGFPALRDDLEVIWSVSRRSRGIAECGTKRL